MTAFCVGLYSRIETIKKIDPNAERITDFDRLISIFSGFDDRYGFTSINELTSARNIADILSSSIRIGKRFLSFVDKVDATISVIQTIQSAFNIISSPSSILPSSLNYISTGTLPDFNDAIISLRANANRVVSSIITKKLPSELATFKKFFSSSTSVFAFYPPSVFPKGLSLSTGLKIQKRPVMIVTNNKADRLFGMGMLLKPGKDISIQFFRMDYGAFNHTPGGDGKNHDVWQDGQFHYHVPRN